MQTTWFAGSATELVDRSRQAAAAAGAKVEHFMGAATTELKGDRAVADTHGAAGARSSA